MSGAMLGGATTGWRSPLPRWRWNRLGVEADLKNLKEARGWTTYRGANWHCRDRDCSAREDDSSARSSARVFRSILSRRSSSERPPSIPSCLVARPTRCWRFSSLIRSSGPFPKKAFGIASVRCSAKTQVAPRRLQIGPILRQSDVASCSDITDATMRVPHIRMTEARLQAGGAHIWMYLFAWGQADATGRRWAAHGTDMPYFFDNVTKRPSPLGRTLTNSSPP